MYYTDKYSQHSSIIWPVWLNDQMFVNKLSWLWVWIKVVNCLLYIWLLWYWLLKYNDSLDIINKVWHPFYKVLVTILNKQKQKNVQTYNIVH